MHGGSGKRLSLVWLLLAALTLSQLGAGSSAGRELLAPNAAVTASVLVIALVKVRIIFREFMDVRHAPVLLGRLTDAWLVATGVILLGAWFAGSAFARG